MKMNELKRNIFIKYIIRGREKLKKKKKVEFGYIYLYKLMNREWGIIYRDNKLNWMNRMMIMIKKKKKK